MKSFRIFGKGVDGDIARLRVQGDGMVGRPTLEIDVGLHTDPQIHESIVTEALRSFENTDGSIGDAPWDFARVHAAGLLKAASLPEKAGFYKKEGSYWLRDKRSEALYTQMVMWNAERFDRHGFCLMETWVSSASNFLELNELVRTQAKSENKIEFAAAIISNIFLLEVASNLGFQRYAQQLAFEIGAISGALSIHALHGKSWRVGERTVEGGRAAARSRHGEQADRDKRDRDIAATVDRFSAKGVSLTNAYARAAIEHGCSAMTVRRARKRAAASLQK